MEIAWRIWQGAHLVSLDRCVETQLIAVEIFVFGDTEGSTAEALARLGVSLRRSNNLEDMEPDPLHGLTSAALLLRSFSQ